MGSTGLIENWTTNPRNIGPIYPFVGWEMTMFAACVAFCVVFFIWKFSTESSKYVARVQQLREPGALAEAMQIVPLSEHSRDDTTDRDEEQ